MFKIFKKKVKETRFTQVMPTRGEAAASLLTLTKVRGEISSQEGMDNSKLISDIDESIVFLSRSLRDYDYITLDMEEYNNMVRAKIHKNLHS